MSEPTPFTADMSDISKLQGTCNWWENTYSTMLQSLKTGTNAAGTKVTLATFEDITTGLDRLGKVRLTEGGAHTAYIKGVSTKITISRA